MVQLVRKKFSRNFLFRSSGKVFLICLVLEIISKKKKPWGINNPRFHSLSILNCNLDCLKCSPSLFSLARENQLHNCSRFFWKISNFQFFIKMKFGSLHGDQFAKKQCLKYFTQQVVLVYHT